MKIDRLIGILSILLQEEKTTAPQLAERFEVSRRTINRDIEALCKAGIPITTAQGSGGGISIMEGYRMDRVVETDRRFICRDVPMPDLSNEKIFSGGIKVKALFTPDMKWRLVEEFGPHCFTESDDGRLLFHAEYTDMDNLVTWLLTFGTKVEVLEPVKVRDIIRRNAEETLRIYMEGSHNEL